MNWVWFLGIIAAVVAAAMMVWRKWIAPWQKIDFLVREIAGGIGPRTFLIDGGSVPRRVALSLEDLFKRQQQLDQQLSERALSTETIFTAMEDGLLVVDSDHRIPLVNRTFQQLFGVPESLPATALLEVTRYPEIDQLVAQTLR